ncbi:MAG: 3-carboxy-cis,cis-muconate cycloisomerase [Mesorhizobium sp.]|nr:3-carboxy-cis,cis-muconate cycloisomerase [Mesorhizobium sp.]MCO5163102.1 3-carboxy-cis,cis-muconate cycloisomerase [Mesorhizobium sp.]
MTVSPFDHPILSGLLGDAELAAFFSTQAESDAMLRFEAALAMAEGEEGVIPIEAAKVIAATLPNIPLHHAALREATLRDGVIVPELVRQLRSGIGAPHDAHVHFGATSQDVIDTGLAIRLAGILPILDDRLASLTAALDALDARDGAIETMGHTRMQAAIPVPATRKILSWRDPLLRHRERLADVRADVGILHFGGAAGTLEKLGDKREAVGRRLAASLGLAFVSRARHNERDGVAALAAWLSLVTGSLGKLGQDIALMAQSEIAEVKLASGGGSSAMPHKVNPVGAEILVTLARFNATLVAGMHEALVHENERSGAAWTLEWLLLPQMVMATGAALRTAGALVGALSFVQKP